MKYWIRISLDHPTPSLIKDVVKFFQKLYISDPIFLMAGITENS